ncbi:hypothetical protein BD770DRAFT_399353 [Pilaira anomala]|nr:hypothetical protein BD770DRAFT_399353 [Pilaira anomala]
MNHPSTLPNEILTTVFKHLSDRQLYQCLFVCQRWLTAAQIILYKEISIDIGFTDDIFETLIFNTLVHSAYTPGRWVKRITVKRLKVPDNMFALDPQVDPLHLLMTHCPFVQEFCFDRTNFIFQAEWQYLQTVLEQRKGTWKLRNLSTHFDKQDYDAYYACALIMQESLNRFYLKKKQLDYATHFLPFSHLTTVSISSRVIPDIIHSDQIIPHVPSLTCLDVEFYIPKTHQIQKQHQQQQQSMQPTSHPYPNLKELVLKNFPISKDQELVFIMQKFIHLDTLKIKVAKGKPWPIARITPSVFQDFFHFISKIRVHSVSFRDIDVVRALEYYFSSTEKDGVFHLCFTNVLDEGDKATSLFISSEEPVKLVYNMVGNSSKDRMNKAQRTLSTYHHHIHHLQLSLLGKEKLARNIDSFLPSVFESCRNLTQLTLTGNLTSHDTMNNRQSRKPTITDLTLNKCRIDLLHIPDFIRQFPTYLNSFQLVNCTFENNESTEYATNYRLDLFDTHFNSIRISFQETGMPGVPNKRNNDFGDPLRPIERNDVFIIINLIEKEITKHYCCDTSLGDLKSVTEETYFEYLDHAKELDQYQLNIFCLNVKSLSSFTLVTPKKYLLCDIS